MALIWCRAFQIRSLWEAKGGYNIVNEEMKTNAQIEDNEMITPWHLRYMYVFHT